MRLWMVGLMLVGCGGVSPAGGGIAAVPTSQCASGQSWVGGSSESQNMAPGQACIACHQQGEGPTFVIAGTVYGELNQKNDCVGASGPQIQITDANGKVTVLNTNAAGNFYLQSRTLAVPYTAKLITPAGERPMGAAQTSGDCNTCHTETGAQNAPGRISVN